jgi:hypothetical protein
MMNSVNNRRLGLDITLDLAIQPGERVKIKRLSPASPLGWQDSRDADTVLNFAVSRQGTWFTDGPHRSHPMTARDCASATGVAPAMVSSILRETTVRANAPDGSRIENAAEDVFYILHVQQAPLRSSVALNAALCLLAVDHPDAQLQELAELAALLGMPCSTATVRNVLVDLGIPAAAGARRHRRHDQLADMLRAAEPRFLPFGHGRWALADLHFKD